MLASASSPHSHPFPFFNELGSWYETKAWHHCSLASVSLLSAEIMCVPLCLLPFENFNWCQIIIIFLSLSGSILSTHQLHLLFFWANCYSLFCTLLTPRSIFQYQELKCFKLRFSNDTYYFVIGIVWFDFFPESCKSIGPIWVNHGQLCISMQSPGDMQRVLRTGGTWWSQSLVNKI